MFKLNFLRIQMLAVVHFIMVLHQAIVVIRVTSRPSEDRYRDVESGFRPQTKNNDALMSRIALADHAQHSIDLQYDIFENDETRHLLAQKAFGRRSRK